MGRQSEPKDQAFCGRGLWRTAASAGPVYTYYVPGIRSIFRKKKATVLPATHPAQPGTLSPDIRRPFPDDANVPVEDTYLPFIQEIGFCAACHHTVFWDTVVYNSTGEWLESPYGNPETGKTCQECHMPSPTIVGANVLTNVAAGVGGAERDPNTLHAHLQPGARNESFFQRIVHEEGKLVVEVDLTNDDTGHHIPTGSPGTAPKCRATTID